MQKAIVTITSDWKDRDHYWPVIKARLISLVNKDIRFIELSNQIETFNTVSAAFILRNSWDYFPEGSVHLMAVNTQYSKKNRHLALEHKNHFFIGPDNGIFPLSLGEIPHKAIEIDAAKFNLEFTSFPELTIYSPAAAMILNGKKIDDLGVPAGEIKEMKALRPAYDNDNINGKIIYIDAYKNAITNISKHLFDKIRENRPFEIYVNSKYRTIKKINLEYSETIPGELTALFNSSGLLEIAIYMGQAADLLSLDSDSNIQVKFINK